MQRLTQLLSALFLLLSTAGALRVCHHNDFMARYAEIDASNRLCSTTDAKVGKCFSSLARLQSAMNLFRCDVRISAADFASGSVYATVFGSDIAAPALNALSYDIAIPGVSELARGFNVFFDIVLRTPSLTWLGTNLRFLSAPRAFSMKKVFNKDGICWLSAITPKLSQVFNLTGALEVSNPTSALRSGMKKCRQKNRVVAVTYLGFREDIELCKSVPLLDLVIGGFTQTDVSSNADYPRRVVRADGTVCWVVTAFAFGRQLGVLDLNFVNGNLKFDGYAILPLDNRIPLDRKVNRLVGGFTRKLVRMGLFDVVGELTAFVSDECRGQECTLGNLICDVLLAETSDGADACLMHAGFVRRPLEQGTVTAGDLLEAMPFPNTYAVITLPGTGIVDALETGLANLQDINPSGRFLQMSGMRLVWDSSARPNNRVLDVKIGGKKLQMNTLYKILTNSFLSEGNSGFDWEGATEIITSKVVIRDLVTDFLKRKENNPYTPIIEGRIKNVA